MSQSDRAETSDAKGVESQAVPQPKRPMSNLTWNLMLIFGALIYSSYTILVHLCEVDGKIPWSSGSMVSVTELMKLVISISMLMSSDPDWRTCLPLRRRYQLPNHASDPSPNDNLFKLSTVLPFSIPAILYCLNNNLAVYIQLQTDPATYQVLGNLKVLTTAFLFRLIIKRPITKIQWLALSLLVLAGVCNSFGGMMNRSYKGNQPSSVIHISFQGLVMILIYCTISGLSGVYTEYVLKKQKELSLHIQNSLLYIYGFILNVMMYLMQSFHDKTEMSNPFHGYSVYTWLLILTQACGGIIMGAIMKYANNITRLFLISSAMVVTTILSMLIFGLKLNMYFIASMLLVIVALVLYHRPTNSSSK